MIHSPSLPLFPSRLKKKNKNFIKFTQFFSFKVWIVVVLDSNSSMCLVDNYCFYLSVIEKKYACYLFSNNSVLPLLCIYTCKIHYMNFHNLF